MQGERSRFISTAAALAFVAAAVLGAASASSSPTPTASPAATSSPSPSPSPRIPPAVPVALHAGDSISDRQLFAYLSYPVASGDWVRYRVAFTDGSTVDKTVGFASERVQGTPTLFIETHVHALPVSGLPAETTVGIGTDAVLKTYVIGSTLGDLARTYRVLTSALKVSSFEYEVSAGNSATYSILTGAVDTSPRYGRLHSIDAVDMRIGRTVVHATRLVAEFPSRSLPAGGVDLPITMEVWQSPDVPLGTVAIKAGGGRYIDWRLVAFGRGGYRSMFSKTLDQIRSASQPAMP
jgi:hypothetical protein